MSDKKNRYFTLRPMYIYNISLDSSWNEKVLGKRCRDNQSTRFMFNNLFPKIVRFM